MRANINNAGADPPLPRLAPALVAGVAISAKHESQSSISMLSRIRDDMRDIRESYGRIGDNEGRFDIAFWQEQGDEAIFNAALDMILDYLMIRHGHADKPRLQRTVESFGKMDWIKAKEASGREQDLIDAKELRKTDR